MSELIEANGLQFYVRDQGSGTPVLLLHGFPDDIHAYDDVAPHWDQLILRAFVVEDGKHKVYQEGPVAAMLDPMDLVSRYTANAGVTWNIWQKYLVADATLRGWSERFMDNDQANTQRRIPASATVDLKLCGEYQRFFWSLSVNNVFNALYYDYAVASSFTPGRFAAYPLPGRTYMVKVGATF